MLRVTAFAIGVCLSASAIARAENAADKVQTPSDDVESRYELLVQMGDRARLAGRNDEAAAVYQAALAIHPQPALRGRYGLVLLKLGHVAKAAEELHEAVERGQGVHESERREVGAAFDKAKAATTWVRINVSQLGAMVTCDGVEWNTKGFASFWHFAMPGEHTLRTQLEGYEEAVETFTATAGENITITLTLVPLVKPKPPVDETLLRKRRFQPPLLGSNVVGDPNYEPREDPSYREPKKDTKPAEKKTGPHFSVSGGVVTLFGVASWNPAVGGVVGIGLRPNDYFSIGIEGRAAVLTERIGDGQISAMTAGGLLSVCGHVKWFFACPLGHLGVIRTEGAKATFNEPPFNHFKPGIGGRLGVRFRPAEHLSLQATAETLALTYPTRIFIGSEMIVNQPAAMVGTQITGEWEF